MKAKSDVIYTPLINVVVENGELTLLESVIFGLVGRLSYYKGYCFTPIDKMAALTATPIQDVQNALKRLRQLHYIAIVPIYAHSTSTSYHGLHMYLTRYMDAWYSVWKFDRTSKQDFIRKASSAWREDCAAHNALAPRLGKPLFDPSLVPKALGGKACPCK